ncbi:EAL domain-containing protein [Synechococcus sp. Cu2B8-bc1011]|uniref:sensor domain-containing protein n=1 Tax=Synechococcus sp. Cu2B8-bc1011 TaxID=3093725 RepID=UPI0039AFE028
MTDSEQPNNNLSVDRLPIRSDVVALLRRAGVEFFRFPLSPEGKAMQEYFKSDEYIHCHFTAPEIMESGSALFLLQSFLQDVHPDDREYMSSVAQALLESDGFGNDITSRPFRGVSLDGRWSWYEVRMSVTRDNDLLICEGLMINVDVQQESSLSLQSSLLCDQLTGLGNLKSAYAHLKDSISTGLPVSLIWLDLKGFGRLNTYLGRAKGDEILRATAVVLQDWLQDGDHLIRPDSDEFLIILNGRDSKAAHSAALHLVQKLPSLLESYGDGFYGLGFHAGISSFPDHGDNEESILSSAASALDQARRINSVAEPIVIFGDYITSRTAELWNLELSLRQAAVNDEFRLVFQPQWNVSGQIVGAEALLRWESPSLGPVSPGVFIPLAEQTGQIHSIGEWVIEAACRTLSSFHGSGDIPPLSINISASQLSSREHDLVKTLLVNLQRFGVAPRYLHVEITESGFLDDLATRRLNGLHEAGICLHIDDFGTGFASLSSLLSLPIYSLKLDQSFVAQLHSFDSSSLESVPSVAILKASLALSSSIGAEAIVEGVEDFSQFDVLRRMGYQVFQGYYFSRPLEFADYCELLGNQAEKSALFSAPSDGDSV